MRRISLFTFFTLVAALPFVGAGCLPFTSSERRDSGVYYTEDQGRTWEHRVFVEEVKKETLLIDDVGVANILFEPGNTSVLYFLARQEDSAGTTGIFKSTDQGQQWTKLKLSDRVTAMAIDPTDIQVMYAAVKDLIYKTTDGGVAWTVVFEETRGQALTHLFLDPRNSGRLYTTTGQDLVVSNDYGHTWAIQETFKKEIDVFAMHPAIGSQLVAKLKNGDLFFSRDSGETFAEAETPDRKEIKTTILPNDINHIVMLASYPNAIYATDKSLGLIKSPDFGATWEVIPTLLNETSISIQTLSVNDNNPDELYFAVGNIIHRSLNGGETWTTIDDFPSKQNITVLLVDPNNTGVVYVGVQVPPKKSNPYFPYL